MSKPQVIVTVDETGKATVETVGVTGPGCEQLSAAIEAAIGVTQSDTKKPEYHQRQAAVQPQAAKQGA